MKLTIEKLIYGGDGLARLPADARGRGKAVFVPFVLADEEIEAAITEEKQGFTRARAESILRSSPERIEPACPHFLRCGGCHYQHAGYEHQLAIKAGILLETLHRVARFEPPCQIITHPSPPWAYRNRSRFQLRTSSGFAAGYFRLASHELLPVEECPISSSLVNRGLAAVWQTGREGHAVEGVREIEFFANSADTQMLAEFICRDGVAEDALAPWATALRNLAPEIAGVSASTPARPAHAIAERRWPVSGAEHLLYETHHAKHRVSAGAFFQTNRHMLDQLVEVVCGGQSGELALDFYAGTGLFSTALARDIHHIVSVESSQLAASDLAYNLPPNGKAVCAAIEKYLTADKGKRKGGSGQKPPDLVVVDPPRSGMGERVAKSVAELGANQIVYVSCDPATLARDLLPLLAAGYKVGEIHLLDMFPQTYHLESVLKLSRK